MAGEHGKTLKNNGQGRIENRTTTGWTETVRKWANRLNLKRHLGTRLARSTADARLDSLSTKVRNMTRKTDGTTAKRLKNHLPAPRAHFLGSEANGSDDHGERLLEQRV
jgi:hypothetical protein